MGNHIQYACGSCATAPRSLGNIPKLNRLHHGSCMQKCIQVWCGWASAKAGKRFSAADPGKNSSGIALFSGVDVGYRCSVGVVATARRGLRLGAARNSLAALPPPLPAKSPPSLPEDIPANNPSFKPTHKRNKNLRSSGKDTARGEGGKVWDSVISLTVRREITVGMFCAGVTSYPAIAHCPRKCSAWRPPNGFVKSAGTCSQSAFESTLFAKSSPPHFVDADLDALHSRERRGKYLFCLLKDISPVKMPAKISSISHVLPCLHRRQSFRTVAW